MKRRSVSARLAIGPGHLIHGTEPPLGFRQFQKIEIRRARIDRGCREALLSAVAAVTRGPPSRRRPALRASQGARQSSARSRSSLSPQSLWLEPISPGPFRLAGRVPTVAVAPADSSAAAAALSQHLLAKLGELQSGETNAIRLTDTNAAQRADLISKVNGFLDDRPSANLSLLSGKDATVLWSGTFDQPSGNPADLKQQIAFSAARMLGCASEGLSLDGKHLDQKTLRLYLKICADLAELGDRENQTLVPRLRDVIARAPQFEAAWSKLLLVQTRATAEEIKSIRFRAAKAAQLRRDIAEARKVDPQMAEAALADPCWCHPANSDGGCPCSTARFKTIPPIPLLSAAASGARRCRPHGELVNDAARAARNDPRSP